MKSFKKLTENGLSMFKKAVSNLEEANRMMAETEVNNTETINMLETENEVLKSDREKNEKIVENIKKIIE